MKLRQKLAVALASAMVITSVPVVTMAASTNGVTKVITAQVSDEATTASTLKIKSEHVEGTESFTITLENAKFPMDFKTATGETETDYKAILAAARLSTSDVHSIKLISETEAIVTVTENPTRALDIEIPLFVKLTGGDAKVNVNPENSSMTASSHVFAKTSESSAAAVVTAGTVPTIYTGSDIELAPVVITETAPNATESVEAREITIVLDSSDYIFDTTSITVTEGRGFAANTTTISGEDLKVDGDQIKFTLPDATASTIKGEFTVTGLTVESKGNPETGDLNVVVSSQEPESGKTKLFEDTTVKVATVADYEVSLEGKNVEMVSGEEKAVEFTLKETIKDSITRGREIEFVLNEGKFTNLPDGVTKTIKNDDKEIIGFKYTVTDAAKVNKTFKGAKVIVPVSVEGEITLTASGRAIGEDRVATLATAARNFKYETETATVKVGLKDQKVGKVTLTEEKAGAFEAGKEIKLVLDKEDGIKFSGKPEVTVTGNNFKVDVQNIVTTDSTIEIVVKVVRASKEAATIVIENLPVSVDRTVAEGKYDLSIQGSAIATEGEIEVEDFFVVGTPNTEDLGANGLVKGTSKFVIGESKYTMNGVEKTMQGAASYIQDPGYTMVPVRYVAEAFGVKGNDILFSNGTATFFAGNRVIQLTNNSDVAMVNGAPIKMATKVVIKDGRTYAPIGEVAQILGIQKDFDSTTKTAIFTNK